VFPRGSVRGQPRRWQEWQKAFIREMYRCDIEGELLYRWILLGVPKKNDKSTMAATLAVHHLLGDPYQTDPWAVCAAASDRQADIVFNDAKTICDISPDLNEATLRYRWEIRPKGGAGKLERVAAAKGKLDGKDISFLDVDEFHEWLKENWDILTNGTVGRSRAQILHTTTAGYDEASICYQEYSKGLRLATGELVDPHYLFWWYGAPRTANHRSEETWRRSNPSYGVTVTRETIADQLAKKDESTFCRYFTNQWRQTLLTWLPAGEWEACNIGAFELEEGAKTAMGWDASTEHDSTGMVTAQPRTCTAGKTHVRVKAKVWERPTRPDGNPVDEWRVPMAECLAHLRDHWTRFDVSGIAYDKAFIVWEADELEATGVPMVEWPQTPMRMVPATQALYEAICTPCECGQRRLEHDGDPALARHLSNVMARSMRGGGQMLEKKQRGKKIDLAIALLMVVGLLTTGKEQKSHGIWIPGDDDEEGDD
jgi:phage terminase large subunit-like protein